MANFHYFSQYKDVEIDFSSYLNKIYEETGFKYTFNNSQPVKVTLKNIFDKIDIISSYTNDVSNFEFWEIDEYDRPETTAYEYYGTVDLWWIVLVANNIRDVFSQWPMNEEQITVLAQSLYETENKYPYTIYHSLLSERNDKLKTIRLIKSDIVYDVIASFRSEFEKYNV